MSKEFDRLSGVYWGIILVVIGGLFLARNLGYIDFQFTMRRYWPLILVLIGLSVVVKSLAKYNDKNPHEPSDHS